MTAPDPAGAAGAATDVVQKAAAPVAFIAIVVGGCLAVAALIRRYGPSLPLPDYLVDFVSPDEDQADEDQGANEPEETSREQWS